MTPNPSIEVPAVPSVPPVQTSAPRPSATGYRLFKRDDAGRLMSPQAPGYRERDYYFQLQIAGKRYLRCLATNDKVLAQTVARQKAKEIKDAVLRGNLAQIAATKSRQTVLATVEEIITAYRAAPVDASAKTRSTNVGALLGVLTLSLGRGQGEGEQSISQINAETARQYFAAKNAEYQAAPDQARQQSIKRGANSRFNQAQSLFIPKALAHYKALGIYHPSMEEFAGAFKIHRFARVSAVDYNPPSEKIIAATLEAWQQIEDRNLFLAIGHELAFGLRVGEVAQATWSWWTTRQGYPVLDGTGKVKNGTGIIQVRALDPYFNLMRARIDANAWRGADNDHIITGTMTHRTDANFRAVSDWLRNQGWETRKTNHALRAYSGSQIAMKYGIYDAQVWLRHSTVKVTESHYSHFVRKFKPANPDDLPVKWAVNHTAPEITVLKAAS